MIAKALLKGGPETVEAMAGMMPDLNEELVTAGLGPRVLKGAGAEILSLC